MKIYLVGGAVRDRLLGLAVKEKDWVVVGATPQQMLAQGFQQVGKEFPVFLHPKTHEEYALARMERKTGPGYKGFSFDTAPSVTLEEDLRRRDLTINAMAETEDGTLIDPYHGKKDLDAKRLRHVSAAFSEDPVRILRVARFAARYAYLGFHVAPETMVLMREMVTSGEVNALVPERVWKELERALSEKNPEVFFGVLEECGALAVLFPELTQASVGMAALKQAVLLTEDTIVRFAALLHAGTKDTINTLCKRYRAPNEYQKLALLVALHWREACGTSELDPAVKPRDDNFSAARDDNFSAARDNNSSTTLDASRSLPRHVFSRGWHDKAQMLLSLFAALDIYRREARFQQFLVACQVIAESQRMSFDKKFLQEAANIAKSIEVKPLLEQGLTGNAIAEKLNELREEKLVEWLEQLEGREKRSSWM